MTNILGTLRRLISAPVRRLFEGFWAVPLLLAAIGLGAALLLSFASSGWFALLGEPSGLRIDEAGARAALSAVATAVMSVVSIVLSLTFVALSVVTQNLSPRMLDFVLRERVVQFLIGTAIATFLFSTTSLSFGSPDEVWRLGIATPVALGLGTTTLFVVVVFAHRISAMIRPDEMVARRGDALLRMLRAAPPRQEDRDDPVVDKGTPLLAQTAGYVSSVDAPALVPFAAARSAVLVIEVVEGDFVLPGQRLGRITSQCDEPDTDGAELGRLLALSNRAEVATGALYEARALAEGAIRALSPGLNDPGTAVACINRVLEALDCVVRRPLSRVFSDEDGHVRVHHRPVDASQLIERALKPIAHHAVGDVDVLEHLQATIERIANEARGSDRNTVAAFIRSLDNQS